MQYSLLNGARLLEITEGSSANGREEFSTAWRDSNPTLVFDSGILKVNNPFIISCDSGEGVSLNSIAGCCVSGAFSTETEFFLIFEGRITLRVSLREEDSIGLPAASFRANNGEVASIE